MSPKSYTTYEPRLVKSLDGTEICADAIGNRAPDFPIIVLIHGHSVIKEAFDPILEDPNWFHNAFLVRYDTRGHGKSGKPLAEEAWESRCIAEDFEAVCKEFDVREAFVLGWSIGATHLADIVAHNTFVKIAGLINVCGPPYINVGLRVMNPDAQIVSRAVTQPASVDAFQEVALTSTRLCSDLMSESLFRKLVVDGVLVQPRGVAMRVSTRKQDREVERFLSEAREGRLPDVLVVVGGRDRWISATEVEGVYKEVGWKKYVLKRLEEADHLPWVSCPEEFRSVVLGWVAERA